MSQHIKSYNDLVYAIAKRARELGDQKMDELRISGAYNCDTDNQAKEMHRGAKRGEIMEFILCEEFVEEFDKEFEE